MEDPTPLDTPEVFGGLKTWLFQGPKYIELEPLGGSLWDRGPLRFPFRGVAGLNAIRAIRAHPGQAQLGPPRCPFANLFRGGFPC